MRIYGDSALDTWRAQLAQGKSLAPPEQAFKVYVPDEIESLDGGAKRQVRFRITTGSPDRMRDTIDPAGWDLKHYKKNPVVMFSHRYDELPVARSVKIATDEKGLTSVAEFATKEQYAFADTVYQLILGGFLKATSVGFKPQKHVYNEQRGGVDFLEQELLEYSICAIPANPDALMEAEEKGIDIEPMREWAQRLLDSAYDEPGVWVPRRQVELMLKTIPAGGRVISLPAITHVKRVGDMEIMSSGKISIENNVQEPKGMAECPRGSGCSAVNNVCNATDCPERPGGASSSSALDDAAIAQRIRELVASGDLLPAVREALEPIEIKPPAERVRFEMEPEPILRVVDDLETEGATLVTPTMVREAFKVAVQEIVVETYNRLKGRVD